MEPSAATTEPSSRVRYEAYQTPFTYSSVQTSVRTSSGLLPKAGSTVEELTAN